MLYLITFCPGGIHLVEGPETFDVYKEYKQWISKIENNIGPEPNITCFGSHQDWARKKMTILIEFQRELDCIGDFNRLFIEHLVSKCGFQLRNYNNVALWG
jgi:hypothetical protein